MPHVPLKDLPDSGAALLAHRPEILAAWIGLDSALLGRDSTLPIALKEDVRDGLSQRVGCSYCASLGASGGQNVDPRESLAMAFAEQVVEDHRSIDASTFEVLREEFTDEQIVELCAWICFKFCTNLLGSISGLEPATDAQRAGYVAWVAEQGAPTSAPAG
jgi:alkylhydroperoxidase family enzyme